MQLPAHGSRVFNQYVHRNDRHLKQELRTGAVGGDNRLTIPGVHSFLGALFLMSIVSDKVPDPKISMRDQGTRLSAASSARGDQSDVDSEDEYVYDIYYRDVNADHQQESKHRGIGSL